MTLPSILIIGAMKAGTTSLYMDLTQHPQIFFDGEKEPHNLCYDEALSPAGRKKYANVYAKALPGQRCCDASTGYAKRPDFEGVPERALETLPEGFQVIYLVRHPIDRIISQHHHEHFAGLVGPSIDEEVRRHPRYIQYSQYAYQLEPWLKLVGRDRILTIQFEEYANRRRETVEEVAKFLGLDSSFVPTDEGKVYNKSQGKPVKTQFWAAVQHNSAYRNFVRPLAPTRLRTAIRQLLLPRASRRLAPPAEATLDFLRESLCDDIRRFREMSGLTLPLWEDFP